MFCFISDLIGLSFWLQVKRLKAPSGALALPPPWLYEQPEV
jgi:hypothetical protein